VKTVLCKFCLQSGILCQKCESKLRSGTITQTDLKIARLLLSLEKHFPSLQDVYFHKAVETDGALAIIVGPGQVSRLLGYGGKIVRKLKEQTGKSIRVIEYGTNDRKFLEDLFAPLNIVTINTIWLPDGSTETRVILKKSRRSSFKISLEALKEIAQKVKNMTLRVEFTD
jgi:transcription antitermination factor NusA-like protein